MQKNYSKDKRENVLQVENTERQEHRKILRQESKETKRQLQKYTHRHIVTDKKILRDRNTMTQRDIGT
jgi:hypothetical protein